MYTGEPIVHHLGENYATAKVGTVGTPIGSLIVNVAYRTRLTMTPQNSYTNEYAGGILIKDDHFNTAAASNSNNMHELKERCQSESNSTTNRYSPITYLDSPPNNNANNSGSSANDKSPKNLNDQSSSSNSSLSKRSSSNLNTIVEVIVFRLFFETITV
jgi:hypothetical protein